MMHPAKPNILMIVADQHRWDCLGVVDRYPIATPHLDQLAREGVWFSQAYTPIPVCGPARQAILSGLAPDRYGGLWNLDFLDCPALQPSDHFHMAGFSRAGYDSTLIGSWNVSRQQSPQDFGFSRQIEVPATVGTEPKQDWPNGWMGDPNPVDLAQSRTHRAARAACAQMRAAAADGKPWLVRVDFKDPHLPCRPSEPFASRVRPEDMVPWDSFADDLAGKPYIQRQQRVNWQLQGRAWSDWQRTVALYFAMISQIDDAVGLMMRQLTALDCEGETIVLYTSDHGDLCGGHGLIDKHYVLYDDVIRVPLILRAPGRIRPGRQIDAFVSHLDLGATFAELCELEGVWAGHGQSLLPLLAGEQQSGREAAICSANGQQFGLYAQRCIRTREWLYVWNLTDVDELYELASDPGQCVNRIRDPACQAPLATLRAHLHEVLRHREDPFVRTDWVRDQLLQGRKLDN